jgi:hypothetical protein
MFMWKDFEDFYKFIAFTGFLWEHALANFLALTQFLFFWVEFKKSRGVPLLGLNFEPPTPWKLGPQGENDTNFAL